MRVIIADDHSLFRDGIVSLMEAAGHEVIAQAGNGEQVVPLVRQLEPDVVLLDITMPGGGGLVALSEIKKILPRMQVVMLTVSDEDEDLFAAVKAGADGYLLKSLNAEEFLGMLEGLEKGEAAITRHTAARLMNSMSRGQEPVKPVAAKLTAREVELLELVAQGLANKSVAIQLSVSENTVKYHMRNILQKLGVQNRTEAVVIAMQEGIIQADS